MLTLGSAVSWGIGNILLKWIGATAQLELMVWLSVVVPFPALAISVAVDGPGGLVRAVATAVVFGERFGLLRLVGMAGVLAGLAVIVLPLGRWARPARAVPLALTLVLVLLTSPAHALTGAEWRRQPELARRAYVDGVIDAWQGVADVQDSLGTVDRGIAVFRDLVYCLRDRLMLPPQIFAIVERHVEDNAGLRSKDMADLMFSALSQACRR